MKALAMKPKFRRSSQSGFTLLEMMVSVTLLVILTGAILGGLGNVQKNYRGDEIRSSLNQQVRATMEIISQEIGQAGLPPSGISGNTLYAGTGASGALATLSAAVTLPAASATVSDITKLQNGMLVVVDTGANAELLIVTNATTNPITVGTVTGTAGFQKAHASGVSLFPQGVYPTGIYFISPSSIPLVASAPTVASTATAFSYQSLIMFGDITGTGMLSIVQYRCPTINPGLTGGTASTAPNPAYFIDSNGVQWGYLTRTEYDYVSGAWVTNPTSNMLDLVRVATLTYGTGTGMGPADGCRFDYNVMTPNALTWYMTTSVNVTIIAESIRPDPTTGNPEVVSKSFMNIQPRNILNAYNTYLYNFNASLAYPYEEFNAVPQIVNTEMGFLTQ